MSRYARFSPVAVSGRTNAAAYVEDDGADEMRRQRDRDHVALVLRLGGFPVFDFSVKPAVIKWPTRARRAAA